MFNITRFALDHSRITIVFMLAIILLGILSYTQIPKTEDPNFVFKVSEIRTYFPGASPDRVEKLITDPLEKAIQEIPEAKIIQSQSKTGLSTIYFHVKDKYRKTRPIWDSLRRKVDKVSHSLPKGIIGPFVNDEMGEVFGTIITITGEDYSPKDLKKYADKLKDQLLKIDDVAKVNFFGDQEERIYILYNDAKLAETGVSTIQLQEFMKNRNILTSGGSITTKNERIYLEPSGSYNTIEDIAKTPFVLSKTGNVLYLGDFAEVKKGYADPPLNLVTSSGKQGIAVAISMQEGGNIFKLGENVKKLLDEMRQDSLLGIEFDIIEFQSDDVKKKVNHFLRDLIISIIIITIFMVFTLGFRTSLILSLMIPMTVLLTFIIMGFLNETINHISLAALIIALGLVVDNGIVISESIITEINNRKPRKQAAIDSCQEYGGALLNSALTTSAAFLPIYLAQSIAGEYTSALFTVVTIALLSSLLLAITMIPFLCVRFLKPVKHEEQLEKHPVYVLYRKILVIFLKRPYLFLFSFILIFFLSFIPLQSVKKTFFPPSERLVIEATFQLPVGTKFEQTLKVSKSIDEYIKRELIYSEEKNPDGITNWISFIGGYVPRYIINYSNDNVGSEFIASLYNLKTKKKGPEIINQIRSYVEHNFPEILLSIKLPQQGPPVASPIDIRISGNNAEKLQDLATTVEDHLRSQGIFYNIHNNWGDKSKKIVVEIDQIKAQRAGMTSMDVAISLQTTLDGFTFMEYRDEDKIIPVLARSIHGDITDINKLETMNVRSQQSDKIVPLKQIANFKVIWQPDVIHRRNVQKTISILAEVDMNKTTPIEAAKGLIPWLNEQKSQWPGGYFYELGGEIEESSSSTQSINDKGLIAIILIIILLTFEFNSIRIPIIILLTIPMGIIGVIIGLYVTDTEMNFMTYLGIISLSGIVLNHSIVLIDRIVIEKDMGKSDQDSIVDAAIRRFRPIVLTASITIVGLIPLLFDKASMFYSMGIALIFGMIVGTLLTLLLIPILYTLFFRVKFDDTYE